MDSAHQSRGAGVPSLHATILIESSIRDHSLRRRGRRADVVCPEVRHAETVIRRILRQPPEDLDAVEARLLRVAEILGKSVPPPGDASATDSQNFISIRARQSDRHRLSSWSSLLAVRLANHIVRRIGRMCHPRGDSLSSALP